MAGMGRLFGADIDAVILDAYWLALHDWTLEDFEGAASKLMQTAEFMPKPAAFTALRRTAISDSAGEAWVQVLDKIRRISPRESATINPKIDAVVRQMGGYGHLAGTNSDQLDWMAKRFRELWAEAGEVEEARLALPSAGGFRVTGPKSAASSLPRLSRTGA